MRQFVIGGLLFLFCLCVFLVGGGGGNIFYNTIKFSTVWS